VLLPTTTYVETMHYLFLNSKQL